MKTGFLITARMKSTRLPSKLIQKLGTREIIRHMIDRLKLAKDLEKIIVCTSANPQDGILKTIVEEEGVDCFLGSEEDVIARLYNAARAFELDYVINITADCPLVAYEYIPVIINQYKEKKPDLIRCFDLPHGLYSYGMDVGAMGKVCEIKDSFNTEVWGRYFSDTGYFKVLDLEIPAKHQRKYRLTLDYPEDLEVFKKIYEYFGKDTFRKTVDEIISYLDKYPQVAALNSGCADKFIKRYNEQDKIKLK
ncbi:MAG: 3-deoxy-manno-octulosonate cytidylyltransferase [Candidatus Omnitrophica bacterium]|nr:3-deoxy-manno-octulosonate cytidylyltransferase [Candidatus Omnitrophota bacterium]MDD5429924.1 3-deoxy-manno-octulosonate cytidylyltransferase [Candidatus Omnitrophota bacterium]